MKDFFFGNAHQFSNIPSFEFESVLAQGCKVGREFFTGQLNRILSLSMGRIVLSDQTSSPSFYQLLDLVVRDEIGFVEIYARTDFNNAVRATLACDILLQNGIVSVVSHWNASQDIRASEIISTLLMPLHERGLQRKAFIRWNDDSTERLCVDSTWDPRGELSKIFDLAKSSSMMADRAQADRFCSLLSESRNSAYAPLGA